MNIDVLKDLSPAEPASAGDLPPFGLFAAGVYPFLEFRWFHEAYYRVLEAFAAGRVRRLIVTMPPQHGKSVGASTLLPAYLLGRNPDLRIAIASYSASLASKFNRRVQRIIDSPEYAAFFPETTIKRGARPPEYLRTADEVEIIGHRGGLLSVGREGALTGNRVDCFILDDLYMDREILQINCIPGTEYVIYGFLDTNDFPNNIFIARVTSKPLPRNMNATVQAEWQLYDGTALETLYPDIYKGASDHRVFIFQVTPTSPETIHTWGLLHVARSTQLNLSDMQILDYLETGTLFGWKNVENGYYFLPAEMETFGFYYCGQDESGAWGELYYEELTFTEDDLCDPKSAPNSGFINGKSAVTPNRTALIATAFTAPVRFCKAAEYGRTPHLLPN